MFLHHGKEDFGGFAALLPLKVLINVIEPSFIQFCHEIRVRYLYEPRGLHLFVARLDDELDIIDLKRNVCLGRSDQRKLSLLLADPFVPLGLKHF